jgi:hypothetical protein
VADGVFPKMLDPERVDRVYQPYPNEGFVKAGGGKGPAGFAVIPDVIVLIGNDLARARMGV